MSTMDSQLTQRNGSLPDLVRLLREQHTAKLDVVIPAVGVRSSGGRWRIEGTGAAVLGPDGVTTNPGTFAPTGTCDAGIADKLGIPAAYLRRPREQHLGLYDANVNGWLEQQPGRRLLIRAFAAQGVRARPGVAVGRYRIVDNLDVLLAALDGVRSAGAGRVRRYDLTERRMYVQIASQSVAAQAAAAARLPAAVHWGPGGGQPAGVRRVRPLQLGDRPRVVLDHPTADRPGLRQRLHDHPRRDAGGPPRRSAGRGRGQWSAGTQQAATALITRQAADATAAFPTGDYLRRSPATSSSGPVSRCGTSRRPSRRGRAVRFTDEQQATILDHFIGGADRTAGGVLQAVTSAAQVQDDADTAYEMERLGLRAMALAAAHQS